MCFFGGVGRFIRVVSIKVVLDYDGVVVDVEVEVGC